MFQSDYVIRFNSMLIHPVRLGLALGFTHFVFILAIGLLSALTKFGDEWVRVFSNIYFGFNTTIVGLIIGILWAFFSALFIGILFAHIFNFFVYLDQSDEYE